MRELREAGFPAAQGVGRGRQRRRPAARPRVRPPGQLQLSLDFDVVSGGGGGGGAGEGRTAAGSPRPRRRSRRVPRRSRPRPATCPARSRPRSWTRGGSRSWTRTASPALEPWLRDQPAVGTGLVVDDPRPLAGTPLSLAVAGDDGRVSPPTAPTPRSPCASCSRRSTPASSGTTSSRCSRRGSPRTPRRAAARRGRSTPRSPPTSSTPRCGPRRSPTSSRSGWTSCCRRRPRACRPSRSRASRRCRRSRSGRRSSRRSRDEGVDRLFAEIELPLIPILARMEAAGIALDRDALADARARVRRRDHAARGARSTPPSATSSRSAAPSSWARSCSSSSACPRAARRRPATRPTRAVLEELRGVHPVDRADPRVADLHQAPLDLRRGAADADRARRPAPHAVPPGRGGDRAAVVVGPEPPEHPDPDAARPPDPARVRRGLAGHDARRRRLQPDRAPDPRPRVRRRAPRATRSRARPTSTARPPPGCSARTPEDVTADERSMAKMVNFGLAYGMSDFGLSSRAGISRQDAQEFINSYFAAYGGISRYMHPHPRDGARSRATCRRCSAASARSRSSRPANRVAARPPASGWRSTCRSRARPPTS